ncbi:MAG: hypothetical protein Q8P82_01125 [bacterium]|nr:hypothetical protein [bacterium]
MKSSATKSLLIELFDNVLLYFEAGRNGPFAASIGRDRYEAFLRYQNAKQYRAAFHRLKTRKLIEFRKRGDDFYIALTKQGAIIALREQIKEKETQCATGEYCLVSFDFPETLRRQRVYFRNFLKSAKFELHHKSVWISQRDVVEELRFLVKLLRAKDWIRVYRAQYTPAEQNK